MRDLVPLWSVASDSRVARSSNSSSPKTSDPMPSRLLALDDDALVKVLTALPQCDDWIFVALTCKALHCAALQAFEIVQTEALVAARLPGVHKSAMRIIGMGSESEHARKRMCTTWCSAMTSPKRFVFVKTHLHHAFYLSDGVLPTFSVPQLLPANVAYANIMRRYEFFSSIHLSTRAIYDLLRHGSLSMIRACFFDVLGGGPGCKLQLQSRHHKALVMFASYFARTDVLDWLVHTPNPDRAKTYNFDEGLLQLFDRSVIRAMLCLSLEHEWSNPQRGKLLDAETLVIQPAYMSDSPAMLEWLDTTILALAERHGAAMRRCVMSDQRMWGNMHPCCFKGITFDGYSPAKRNGLTWQIVRKAFAGAAASGTTKVLQHMYLTARRYVEYWIWGQRFCEHRDWYKEGFSAALVFSLFACVLGNENRNGASMRWLERVCQTDAVWFTRLAQMHDPRDEDDVDHEFRNDIDGTTFDLEDLLFVLGNDHSWYCRNYLAEQMNLPPDHVLRDGLLEPGDVEHNEWVLAQFKFPTPPANDSSTAWFARSIPKVRASSLALVRTRLDANRWDTKDAVCRHLVRRGQHMRRVLLARPRPEESNPLSHVYWHRLSERRSWLPHLSLPGPSRIDDGLAFVLGEWVHHVLAHGPQDEEIAEGKDTWERCTQAWQLWSWMLLSLAPACFAPMEDACRTLLALDVPHKARIRAVLRDLLAVQCTSLTFNTETEVEGQTCAVAYLELMCKHDLLTKNLVQHVLEVCTESTPLQRQQPSQFEHAMRRVLVAHGHELP